MRHGWVVISMKDEGKRIFPFEKSARSPQIRDQRGRSRRVRGRPIRSLRPTDRPFLPVFVGPDRPLTIFFDSFGRKGR